MYDKKPIGNIWEATKSINNQFLKEHTNGAPFPKSIVETAIRLMGDGCKTILDPFSGSGTTLVAAKHLNKKSIGIEKEKEYADMTIDRLKQNELELAVST